jgi:hypothetical protein
MSPAPCRAWCPLVVAMLAAWGAGCVIPVGPEFQDPLGAQNYAPQITSANPPEGAVTSSLTFQIAVTDPNVGDTLYVRWIADYPDYQEQRTRTLRSDEEGPPSEGMPTPRQFSTTISCNDFDPAGAENILGRHQIMVVVSDRAFADDDVRRPEKAADGGLTDAANWTLNLSCPPTR